MISFNQDDYVRMLKYYYTRVNACTITDDGYYLLAFLKNDEVAVYEIKNILAESNVDDNLEKSERHTPQDILSIDCSHSVVNEPSTDDGVKRFWASGNGQIKLFSLESSISEDEESVKLFSLTKIPLSGALLKVNVLKSTKNHLYCGSNDNNIYIFDKESQKNIQTINAHRDSVSVLRIFEDDNTLFSASFDGTIKRWDLRSPSNDSVIEIAPGLNDNVCRKDYGRWINALDITPNMEFLVCGGGPKLSLWHCKSGRLVNQFECPSRVNFAEFSTNDQTIVNFSGSEKLYSKWDISKNSQTTIKSSIPNIYNVNRYRYEDLDYDLMVLSGNSFKIELCRNDTYVDIPLYIH